MAYPERWHFQIGINSRETENRISKIGKHPNTDLIWDDIRAFLAVTRAGTLSGAVAQLGVGVATVSRRIERLELAVGQPVFTRHQSGYRLTADGAALIERAEEMEAAALSLTSGLRHDAPVAGTVRLATAENLATGLVIPKLAQLKAEYPHLSLEIVTDVATINLHRRDADIALRMVKPDRGNVSLQRLGSLGFGLYASAEYVSARDVSSGTNAFDHDDFITWSEAYANLPAARWVERILNGRPSTLATTSLATQLIACESGLGLAILPHFLARPRGLICLNAELGADQTIWLVTHSDLVHSRRVRAVAEFLRGLMQKNLSLLSG